MYMLWYGFFYFKVYVVVGYVGLKKKFLKGYKYLKRNLLKFFVYLEELGYVVCDVNCLGVVYLLLCDNLIVCLWWL